MSVAEPRTLAELVNDWNDKKASAEYYAKLRQEAIDAEKVAESKLRETMGELSVYEFHFNGRLVYIPLTGYPAGTAPVLSRPLPDAYCVSLPGVTDPVVTASAGEVLDIEFEDMAMVRRRTVPATPPVAEAVVDQLDVRRGKSFGLTQAEIQDALNP